MSRTVFCEKLQRDCEGLAFVPWPGALGKRVFEHIGREAWQQWLAHQTMLINENRLSPMNPKDRALLETEMEKFLFAGGAEKPAGYVPPEA
ncbi:MAG TPA: oxidative damage protection protein [Arenimonas sp.]|uniref:oxidative damage protection protein n=1 Tax=Arenimonas sp. TaxID=1872635 RepID=UPI002D7E164F|nr:oxidative damage protection protein [Arenimonas sp.]HEU0153882.1 oxidative damage protection protein [Arenimonas sp.]